jgi:hypothetical protein
LQFVIITDHGDGTGPLAPPVYLDGVLCVDGVEVSTNGGHYVAIDMPVAPYPLGGDAAAVVEDVSRLGGFGIAAHPHHPRREIAWTDWSTPIQGIEWINLDAEWRDDGAARLIRMPFDYLLRPAAAIASLLDRPTATIEQWDRLERSRPVIALAAVDAHGAGRRSGEGRAANLGLGPGYEASFRTLSNTVLLERPFAGVAASDARLLYDAIRKGSVYTVIDALATGAVLARRGPEGPFTVASALPDGARPDPVDDEGRSRLEVQLARSPGLPPVPWVFSNWVGPRRSVPSPHMPDVAIGSLPALSSPWRVEKDPASSGQVTTADGGFSLNYALAMGRSSQFVAAAADLAAGQGVSRPLGFEGSAVKPMRVSVQLRFADGARWVKSVYLDAALRRVTIGTEDMTPADPSGTAIPDPSTALSILFVVDLVNAKPGDSGSFSISTVSRRP